MWDFAKKWPLTLSSSYCSSSFLYTPKSVSILNYCTISLLLPHHHPLTLYVCISFSKSSSLYINEGKRERERVCVCGIMALTFSLSLIRLLRCTDECRWPLNRQAAAYTIHMPTVSVRINCTCMYILGLKMPLSTSNHQRTNDRAIQAKQERERKWKRDEKRKDQIQSKRPFACNTQSVNRDRSEKKRIKWEEREKVNHIRDTMNSYEALKWRWIS